MNYMEMQEDIMVACRRLSEQCDLLSSLLFFGSINGGTGSGLMTGLVMTLGDMFPKLPKTNHALISSKDLADMTVQPYNNVLSLAETNDSLAMRFVYDNQSMDNILNPILKSQFQHCEYSDINHLISLVHSGITACSRFMGSDQESNMFINLNPFPSLILNTAAISPIKMPRCRHLLSEYTLTFDAFLSNNEMIDVDLLNISGAYISCCLFFRGNIGLKKVNDALYELKTNRQLRFVSWIPTGVKTSLCSRPMVHDEENQKYNNPVKALLKVSNHTSITTDVCEPILEKYSRMLQSRAYLFWYISEGMEEGEFADAQEKLQESIEFAKGLFMDSGVNE